MKPAAPVDLRPGAEVDGYVLRHELGSGATGRVYLAVQRDTGAARALKFLLALDEPEQAQRFAREAEALARVDGHPHVIRVHGCGVWRGRIPYLVLEYAAKGDLGRLLKRRGGRLAPSVAATLVRELALGAAALHAQGLVHRDLKPGNVLFTSDGRAVLADFGLVKLLGPEAERLTRTGQLLGTPCYMSPEQARADHGQIDERSDVYGLGTILYELLTGEPPHPGPGLAEYLAQVTRAQAPSCRALVPEVPADLDAIVRQALAKRPGDRFASAEELAAALADHLAGRRALRQRGPALAAGLVAVSAAAFVGLALVAGNGSRVDGRGGGGLAPVHTEVATAASPSPSVLPQASPDPLRDRPGSGIRDDPGALLSYEPGISQRDVTRQVFNKLLSELGANVGELHTKAEAGEPTAIRDLALLYEVGVTVERDNDQAVRLYRQAGELGDGLAWNRLGRLLERLGDDEGALQAWRRGQEVGDHDSGVRAANSLLAGKAGPPDRPQALAVLEVSARQGWAEACSELAALLTYLAPRGEAQPGQAWRFLEVGLEQQDATCLYLASLLRGDGIGRPADQAESRRLLELAAAKEEPRAMRTLAVALIEEAGRDRPPPQRAVDLLIRAREKSDGAARRILEELGLGRN